MQRMMKIGRSVDFATRNAKYLDVLLAMKNAQRIHIFGEYDVTRVASRGSIKSEGYLRRADHVRKHKCNISDQ